MGGRGGGGGEGRQALSRLYLGGIIARYIFDYGAPSGLSEFNT